MASKTNRTPDGRHVQFGDRDTYKTIEGFTAPDNGATCSGWFGLMMTDDDIPYNAPADYSTD